MAKRADRPAPKAALSHLDEKGKARMVDVGDKPVTSREALARGEITMSATALRLIRQGALAKGDPLQTARLAGIMAAKRTAELIPLCHPLPLTHVSVEMTPTRRGYRIEDRVDGARRIRLLQTRLRGHGVDQFGFVHVKASFLLLLRRHASAGARYSSGPKTGSTVKPATAALRRPGALQKLLEAPTPVARRGSVCRTSAG